MISTNFVYLTKFDFIEIHFDGMTAPHPRDFSYDWTAWKDCPEGTFIDGFSVRHHVMMGLTGIEVTCSTKMGNRIGG